MTNEHSANVIPPLADRAKAAWTWAFLARHEANWGRLVYCRNRLGRYMRDPHPCIRRLATAFQGEQPPPGRAA